MHTLSTGALALALSLAAATAHAESPAPTSMPGDDVDSLFVLGFASAGVSAASLVMFGVAASRIQQLEDEPAYRRYREGFAENESVCERAAEGAASPVMGAAPPLRVRNVCSEADTWEIVSFVTLPLAIASAGAAVLLWSTSDTVIVGVSPTGASLTARF